MINGLPIIRHSPPLYPPPSQPNTPNFYEQKYKKALKSIQGIVIANKQIKQQLDHQRTLRTQQLQSFSTQQKEQFQKLYQTLLKQKNQVVITLQNTSFQNQKLRLQVNQLQARLQIQIQANAQRKNNQVIQLKEQNQNRLYVGFKKERETEESVQHYQEQRRSLTSANSKLQNKIKQLQKKLDAVTKQNSNKLQEKQIELLRVSRQIRQEFKEELALFKKQNIRLKASNSELTSRFENFTHKSQNLQKSQSDDLLIEQIQSLRIVLEPLQRQILEMEQTSLLQRQQYIKQNSSLQARIIQLQSECSRQADRNRELETKLLSIHKQTKKAQEYELKIKNLTQQNQLIKGQIVVIQSRDVALKFRQGDDLSQRVTQFQKRIQLLLQNKDGISELRQAGIHQLVAMKAYIMQLDSKIKQLISSNQYLVKKYNSYKQKYQKARGSTKQYELTINSLKIKIMGYQKLIEKMQRQITIAVDAPQPQLIQNNQGHQIYIQKIQLLSDKLQTLQKYNRQEVQTLRLEYQGKIMQMTIQIEELRSKSQNIQLYRSKVYQLQKQIVQQRQLQLTKSKRLSLQQNERSSHHNKNLQISTKINITNQITMTRLENQIKIKDDTIFDLRQQLRQSQENETRRVRNIQKQTEETVSFYKEQLVKKENDLNRVFEEERSRHRIQIMNIQHQKRLIEFSQNQNSFKDQQNVSTKIQILQNQLDQANISVQQQRQINRDLYIQLQQVQYDCQQLQSQNRQLQYKVTKLQQIESQRNIQKDRYVPSQPAVDFKDATIRKLNEQLWQVREELNKRGELDITISSQKNDIFYLKKQIEDLNLTNQRYNSQINSLRESLRSNQYNSSSGYQEILQQKQASIQRIKKQLLILQKKVEQSEQFSQKITRQNEYLKRQINSLQESSQQAQQYNQELRDRQWTIQQLQQQKKQIFVQFQFVKSQNSQLKNELRHARQELLDKQNVQSQLQIEHQRYITLLKDDYQSRIRHEINGKDNIFNSLVAENNTLKSTFAIKQQQLISLEQTNRRSIQDLNNAKQQISQLKDTVSQLKNQILQKTNQINKLQIQYRKSQTQLQDYVHRHQDDLHYKDQLTKLRTQNSYTIELLQNQKATCSHLQTQLTQLTQQNQTIQNDLYRSQSIISSLRADLDAHRNNQKGFDVFQQQQKNTVLQLNAQRKDLRQKISILEQQLDNMSHALNAERQHILKMQNQLAFCEQQLIRKDTIISKMNNEHQSFKAEIQFLQNQLNQKVNEVSSSKKQIFDLQFAQLQKQQSIRRQLQQQISALMNKIAIIQQQLAYKDQQIASRNQKIAYKDQQIAQKNRRIADEDRQKRTFNEQIRQKNKYIQQIQSRFLHQQQVSRVKQDESRQIQRQRFQRQQLENTLTRKLQEAEQYISGLLQNQTARQEQFKIIKQKYEIQIKQLSQQNTSKIPQSPRSRSDNSSNLSKYRHQTDKLAQIIRSLQKQVDGFKNKIALMMRQRTPMDHNINDLTSLFNQMNQLRTRIKCKQEAIRSVKQEFISLQQQQYQQNQVERVTVRRSDIYQQSPASQNALKRSHDQSNITDSAANTRGYITIKIQNAGQILSPSPSQYRAKVIEQPYNQYRTRPI